MTEKEFSKICTKVVEDLVKLTREKYVYPEMGEKIAAQLTLNLQNRKYDALKDENELAQNLTIDLQKISNDLHWYVAYDPQSAVAEVDPEQEKKKSKLARYLEYQRRVNFGFRRVECLKGNIGYIDLRSFQPSEHAGEAAVAAMNFIANCDALIFDLRQNHGGYPSMVQLIISYLIEPKPQLINTFFYRPTGNTQQFWTFPHIPGKRMPDIPVYVLTSRETGSGAEEFAYDLKHMKRATLIGETTHGAAHPVNREIIQKVFSVHLPYGRPINPITGTNWETTGVEPNIAVPANEAVKTAHLHALKHLMKRSRDKDEKRDLDWSYEIIESEYAQVVLHRTDLERCSGQFGKRKFHIDNGVLMYGHQDLQEAWALIAMSKTRFRLDEDLKFEFLMNESGKASAVKISYKDGRPQITTRRT